MPTRITWPAATPTPADFYEVRVAATTTSPFLLAGAVMDGAPLTFDDPQGTDLSVYRVQGFLAGALVSDTGIFAPQVSFAANLATRQKVDHHYTALDAYRYITPGGAGIPQATIRVFQRPDWDAGRNRVALFATETDNDGRWASPFWLEPGMSYVLTFEKRGSFGPDVVTIAVT